MGLLVVRRQFYAILLLVLFAGSVQVMSQEASVKMPDTSNYHFNFSRNFFPSPDAEKDSLAGYYTLLDDLQSLKGQITSSATNLLRALQIYDQALVQYKLHSTYWYLQYAINTTDQASLDESRHLDQEFSLRTAFLFQELMELSENELRALTSYPGLQKYNFAILAARRYQSHTRSTAEEETFRFLQPSIDGWQYDLYEQLLSRADFGTINTSHGPANVLGQRIVIANDKDRSVREKGFKLLYEGYGRERDLFAFTLIGVNKANNAMAQFHHFDDAPTEAYFRSHWTKQEVTDLLNRIALKAGIFKRYQELRSGNVMKKAGYPGKAIWDWSAPLSNDTVPQFSIKQASELVLNSVKPLGREFVTEWSLLLDPRNGRMDILSGKNRKRGGFSKGFPGVTTVFFTHDFQGYYNDVRILIHEATHAVHRQLMKNNAVLPCYADGPHYLFESFAMFDELLLPMYLYEHEADHRRKQYYLEQFFDGKGMALFFVGRDALLEQAICDSVASGMLTGASEIDSLTRHINSLFTIWGDRHRELDMDWMRQGLFYEDPFYNINYVWGSLLALKYYQLFKKDPNWFVPRYIALMKNGFTDTPEALLRQFLDIDLHGKSILDDAITVLDTNLKLLQNEYEQ